MTKSSLFFSGHLAHTQKIDELLMQLPAASGLQILQENGHKLAIWQKFKNKALKVFP